MKVKLLTGLFLLCIVEVADATSIDFDYISSSHMNVTKCDENKSMLLSDYPFLNLLSNFEVFSTDIFQVESINDVNFKLSGNPESSIILKACDNSNAGLISKLVSNLIYALAYSDIISARSFTDRPTFH
jgi:hypothetical protein